MIYHRKERIQRINKKSKKQKTDNRAYCQKAGGQSSTGHVDQIQEPAKGT